MFDTSLKLTRLSDWTPKAFHLHSQNRIKCVISLSDEKSMVAIWVILGLILSAVTVSLLGAAFSVIGLAALFSGAALAVIAMASSLEFAKFTLSAYLHQRWNHLNGFFKFYLLFAIVTLSLITSLGIFGFLSDAYQSASTSLEAENIKMEALKTEQNRNTSEIARITKNIEEIPVERMSRRLKARAEAEPLIAGLSKKNEELDRRVAEANLKILEIKKRVGPLIYISRTFKIDIDTVVKYLILLFVSVFDPLAICLVIATSEALESRKKAKQMAASPVATITPTAPAPATETVPTQESVPSVATNNPMSSDHPSEEILQMRFVDDPDRKSV